MRGNTRRRSALTHAQTITDRAATFEDAILFEGLQISIPVTQIAACRVVMHEENVIGHGCHLLRAIQNAAAYGCRRELMRLIPLRLVSRSRAQLTQV